MPTTLYENRPSAGIGVVEVQKLEVFCNFVIVFCPARLSVGIGVVEVQNFCDFALARATLCEDRRGRGAKTRGFLRFCFGSRDPLRGSAWSRCKNSFFLVILARATLCGDRRGCKNSWFFATFVVRAGPWELSRGSRACSQDRRVVCSIPSWSAGGLRKLHGATCIKQLAQSNLRRATCTDQFAQSNLRRATCTDQFAQSALTRATCAEPLTQSNLHRATRTAQLAQSNLQGATCKE